jgi:hypothetical protein
MKSSEALDRGSRVRVRSARHGRAPHRRGRESEGRRRQDHHRGEPRGGPRAQRGSRRCWSTSTSRAARAPPSARRPEEGQVDVARVLLEEEPLPRRAWCPRASSTSRSRPRASDGPGRPAPRVGLRPRAGLRARAARAPVCRRMDVMVVDTAPYLGLLTVNALVAAHKVLIPVSCEYLPMLGLKLLGDTLPEAPRPRGREGRGAGLPAHPGRPPRAHHRGGRGAAPRALRRAVFETVIRANTHHKAAPSHRKTIFEHEPAGGAAARTTRASPPR